MGFGFGNRSSKSQIANDFHRTLQSQCSIALSCLQNRSDFLGPRWASQLQIAKFRCDFGALSCQARMHFACRVWEILLGKQKELRIFKPPPTPDFTSKHHFRLSVRKDVSRSGMEPCTRKAIVQGGPDDSDEGDEFSKCR